MLLGMDESTWPFRSYCRQVWSRQLNACWQ